MTLLAPTRLDKDDAKERTQNRSDGGTRENPQTHGDDAKGDDRRQNKYGRGDKNPQTHRRDAKGDIWRPLRTNKEDKDNNINESQSCRERSVWSERERGHRESESNIRSLN